MKNKNVIISGRIPKKTIHVYKSKTTGRCWYWTVGFVNEQGQCVGETYFGQADTKREAKQAAKNVPMPTMMKLPTSIKKIISINPPQVDAKIINGYLSEFTVYDSDDQKISFSTEEISQNTALWVFEIDDCFDSSLSEEYELVIAMLKIWRVFKGGVNRETVQNLHNLSDSDFDTIVNRNWNEIKINIDENNNFIWDIII
ncbi:MAG TPA: hypothetical protein PKX15_07395 [Bacteroidales bacterium]|jgi:hypothetical protein|nr:hypothetical protein [Bacteroidales bacterium]